MAKSITIKPEEEFARSYADRLILQQLTEIEVFKLGDLAERLSDSGLGLSALRSLLASNPKRFAFHDRRWIPAARLEGVGRPMAEAIRLLIEGFGTPVPLPTLVSELSRVRDEGREQVAVKVERIVSRDPTFLLTSRGDVALAKWAFLASGEKPERAFALHGVKPEDVEAAQKKLANIDWRSETAAADALKASAPISAKVLGAVAWLALNPADPRATLLYDGRRLFAEMLSVEGYVMGSDGVIYPAGETKKWITSAVKVADKLAPTIEVEDVAPVDVKPADIDKMVAKILASDKSVTATRLLEEFYEITTVNKTFRDDLANVVEALCTSDKVVWVGADRFRKAGTIPDFIHAVPEPFFFVPTEFRGEDGELIDVEIADEGLSTSLRKLLTHPLATDVLDEEGVAAPKSSPDKVRLVLKSMHRELGTFPMCQIPAGWIEDKPTIQEIILVDDSGRELQVWANTEARLLFGFLDWWYEQPIESGAVFNLSKTSRPNVFEFSWEEQADPLLYISSQRMEQLRDLQSRSESMSTLDLLIEIMHHWPKGTDFLTLLAEVNVVRRSSRRLVASLLSCYQCFYQRSGSPVWHFDPKKIELGFDKTKRKFVKK